MWGFNLAVDVLSQVAAGIGLRLKRVAYASNDLGLPRNAMPRRDSAAGRGAISGRVGIRVPADFGRSGARIRTLYRVEAALRNFSENFIPVAAKYRQAAGSYHCKS
jgi:hypothetical protein